ncbi:MAG: TetR family transcriptional regulator [Eggerthellaceae bacterium]
MGLLRAQAPRHADAIERAAIALVSERGYDNVTVAQICRRLPCPKARSSTTSARKTRLSWASASTTSMPTLRAAFDRLMPCSMLHATLTLFLEVAGSFDWESDIAAQRIALVSETPSLMQLFLDNAFGFVSDFRNIVEAYFEANPSLRTCSDVLSSAEESYIVVSEALEAAKFALYRVADDPASGLPSADEVEAVIRRIVG